MGEDTASSSEMKLSFIIGGINQHDAESEQLGRSDTRRYEHANHPPLLVLHERHDLGAYMTHGMGSFFGPP